MFETQHVRVSQRRKADTVIDWYLPTTRDRYDILWVQVWVELPLARDTQAGTWINSESAMKRRLKISLAPEATAEVQATDFLASVVRRRCLRLALWQDHCLANAVAIAFCSGHPKSVFFLPSSSYQDGKIYFEVATPRRDSTQEETSSSPPGNCETSAEHR